MIMNLHLRFLRYLLFTVRILFQEVNLVVFLYRRTKCFSPICESKKLEMLHLHCKTSSGSTWKEKNDGLLNDVKTDIGSKNS